jgi:hypothetical protein
MGNLSAEGRRDFEARQRVEKIRVSEERRKIASKIVMVIVDKIVNSIVRPGPVPEERECYEMAGELRGIIPELEKLTEQVIDAEDGVE